MAAPRRSFLMSLAGAPLLPVALTQVAPNPRPASPTPAPSPSDTPSQMAESPAEAARHSFGAPTGAMGPLSPVITPDGRYYAFAYARRLSDLYVVEGLH